MFPTVMNRIGCLVFSLCGLLLTAGFAGEAPALPANTNSPVATQPPELAIFGEAGPGKIKVKVTGEVKRPGIYYLKANAVIADALEAAQGKTEFFGWRNARLMRAEAGQTNDVLYMRKKNYSIPLVDGDWLLIHQPAD